MKAPADLQLRNASLVHRGQHLSALRQTTKQLATGARVTSAADDAAGLSVGLNQRATARGYRQAIRNANEAAAMLQTAEGGLASQVEVLIRMRQLAIQSASDGVTTKERLHIQEEYNDLRLELDRIVGVTEYNGQSLIDATGGDGSGKFQFQIGVEGSVDSRMRVRIRDHSVVSLIGNVVQKVVTQGGARKALAQVDQALDRVTTSRTEIGSKLQRLDSALRYASDSQENAQSSASQQLDADFGAVSTEYAKAQVLTQANLAMTVHANTGMAAHLSLIGAR